MLKHNTALVIVEKILHSSLSVDFQYNFNALNVFFIRENNIVFRIFKYYTKKELYNDYSEQINRLMLTKIIDFILVSSCLT